jgi:hypothetical protein
VMRFSIKLRWRWFDVVIWVWTRRRQLIIHIKAIIASRAVHISFIRQFRQGWLRIERWELGRSFHSRVNLVVNDIHGLKLWNLSSCTSWIWAAGGWWVFRWKVIVTVRVISV